MNNVFGVYTHAKPDGTVFYVGKGKVKRARELRYGRNTWHTRVVKKYGLENIIVKFKPCKSEAHAFKLEIRLIRFYRRRGITLVNKCDGGEGKSGWRHSKATVEKMKQRKWSEETRTKMLKVLRGRKHSVEARKKMSIAQFGKRHSAESIEKQAAKLRGRKLSADRCRMISEGMKNRRLTDEQRAAYSRYAAEYWARPENRKRAREHRLGKKRPPETCAKIGAAFIGKKLSSEHRAKLKSAHLGKRLSITHAEAIRNGQRRGREERASLLIAWLTIIVALSNPMHVAT